MQISFLKTYQIQFVFTRSFGYGIQGVGGAMEIVQAKSRIGLHLQGKVNKLH